MSTTVKQRCAIYTRKSSEEGLDQEFNSLDAQREACAAFVLSQAGFGWKLVTERYDDGGMSGGTMERPALLRLLHDIRDRKVDVVVVYKIDRLTRSLVDFARIVEIFDGHGVSFVSVTQQFNTTTSMGRLTLNVLLSFAQFEREVTAERIRDKIAASKRKGMWMGGKVPFGYQAIERKLVIDAEAAKEVRRLFERYLQLRSVPALAREINRSRSANDTAAPAIEASAEFESTPPSPGRPGRLYHLLANPIYIGKVRHHREIFEGEHEPIVDRETFDRVQALLAEQAPRGKGLVAGQDNHLLNGLLFDDTGDRMSPVHAAKKGKRYRYYISSRLKATKRGVGDGWRIPAAEIEAVVLHRLRGLFADKVMLAGWVNEFASSRMVEAAMRRADEILTRLKDAASRSDHMRVLRLVFRKITLDTERLRFEVDAAGVADWLTNQHATEVRETSRPAHGEASPHQSDRIAMLELPIVLKRRGVEARIVVEGKERIERRADEALVNLIARAHLYLRALTDGPAANVTDVARMFGAHRADVSRILPLAFLAPKIVEAILTGCQPVDLSARRLARSIDLPLDWTKQVDGFFA